MMGKRLVLPALFCVLLVAAVLMILRALPRQKPPITSEIFVLGFEPGKTVEAAGVEIDLKDFLDAQPTGGQLIGGGGDGQMHYTSFGDPAKVQELSRSGRVFNVSSRTSVLIIERDGKFSQVEFCGGEHKGERAWILQVFVHRPTDPNPWDEIHRLAPGGIG